MLAVSAWRLCQGAFCFAFLTIVFGAAADAVPLNSSLQLHPYAHESGSAEDAPGFVDSQLAMIDALTGSLSATSGNVSVSASASATWISAGQGTVQFENSWNTVNTVAGEMAYYSSGGGTRFLYEFIADADGQLVVDYTTSATGSNIFGVVNFTMGLFNVTLGGSVFPTVANNASSSAVFDLVAGIHYSFLIADSSNASGGLATRDMLHTGTFAWSAPINDVDVGEVPLPLSLPLFASGVAFLGAIGGRRRRTSRDRS